MYSNDRDSSQATEFIDTKQAECPTCEGSRYLLNLTTNNTDNIVLICKECANVWTNPSKLGWDDLTNEKKLGEVFKVTNSRDLFVGNNSGWTTEEEANNSKWKNLVKDNPSLLKVRKEERIWVYRLGRVKSNALYKPTEISNNHLIASLGWIRGRTLYAGTCTEKQVCEILAGSSSLLLVRVPLRSNITHKQKYKRYCYLHYPLHQQTLKVSVHEYKNCYAVVRVHGSFKCEIDVFELKTVYKILKMTNYQPHIKVGKENQLLRDELLELRGIITNLELRSKSLLEENRALKERLGLNSKSSSLSPSRDLYRSKRNNFTPSLKKPDGQIGHGPQGYKL
eukprot:gene110-146_t